MDNPIIAHLISSHYYPDYAQNTSACNAFHNWRIEKPFLFNCQDAVLTKIVSLNFFKNNVSNRSIKPVSLYIAPHVLKTHPMSGILVFDFDQTLTDKHTLGHDFDESDLTGYHMDNSQREVNLRHAMAVRTMLITAKAKHIRIAVITRHHDMAHVLAYLQTLVTGISVDAAIYDYFSIVLCSPTPMGYALGVHEKTEGMKDGELVFVSKLLNVDKLLLPIPLLIVDDEMCNQPTERVNMHMNDKVDVSFAHAAPDTIASMATSSSSIVTPPSYLDVITAFISRITEITPTLTPSPASLLLSA